MGVFSKEEKPVNKIDYATAENDFNQFCNDWDIDIDVSKFDEEETKDFERLKRQIVRKIESGNLIYNHEDETFIYKCLKPVKDNQGNPMLNQSFTLACKDMASNWSMDRFKKKESMKMVSAKIGQMIDRPINYVSGIHEVDGKILNAVLSLFLSS
jgi:hypothetical protein